MAYKLKLPFFPLEITLSKKQPFGKVIDRNYNKIFVIGFNKTGTTTLKKTLSLWDFRIGNQKVASMMMEDYFNKRYERIFSLVETADAFQDVPFSQPNLYRELDKKFPGSKFILSLRDSEDQWFESLLNFHSKKVGRKPPNENDLANVDNIYKGWLLDVIKMGLDNPGIDLYDENYYKKKYLKHNQDVKEYFKNRPNDFVQINVSKKEDFQELVSFLNIETNMKSFPWLNKTKKKK